MKFTSIVLITLFSLPAFARSEKRFIGSDGVDLVNLLLMPETQKCLKEKNFEGSGFLNDATKVEFEIREEVTTYEITVEKRKILPADGTAVESAKIVTIVSTEELNRAGLAKHVTCSVATAEKE